MQRDQRGGFTALAFIAALPLLVALTAFGIDMKHHQTAQQQLQKATDAAALAGAEMLWSDGTYSMDSNSFTENPDYPIVKQHAFAVAGLNLADGKSVSNSTPGVTVTVNVEEPPKLPTVPPPLLVLPPALQSLNLPVLPPTPIAQIQALFAPTVGGKTGTVRVTAEMYVDNIFSKIFGRSIDKVTATSKAGSTGPAYSVNAGQLFPVAVSWLSVPTVNVGLGKSLVDLPLVAKRVGDPIVVNVSPALDQNAAFTTFNTGSAPAAYVPQAMDQYLGVTPLVVDDPSKVIPPVRIGQSVNTMFDATSFAKLQAEGPNLTGKVLYMPVVVINLPLSVVTGLVGGNVGGLVNNVNALGTSLLGLNQVIGFIAVKVDSISVSPTGVLTIKGMIVNGQRFGSNKYSGIGLLPALLNTLLGLIGISGGQLLPVVSPGQTYPLTATQTVKLLQ